MPTRMLLSAHPSNSSATLERDRRRRQRIEAATIGYLLPEKTSGRAGARLSAAKLKTDEEPWEVRIHDVSRLGVGFVSASAMKIGDFCRIRIGVGPMRLARRMRIVNCQPESPNHFRIGAEFA